jgi:sugar (pentulose or hexulose) kinase
MAAAEASFTGENLFIGLDLGTGGVRALAVETSGRVVAQASVGLATSRPTQVEEGHEQDPLDWWEASCRALSGLVQQLNAAGVALQALRALAIDGTSGTLVCLDEQRRPLCPALMYNDGRARTQALQVTDLAGDFCARLGYRFEASFALAKIVWIQQRTPDIFARTVRFAHQADYIQGNLTGEDGIADYSNALKTGYDLEKESWPQWLDQLPGVSERLPQVVAPGVQVGQICSAAARQTGLPAGLAVVSGATDATAACLASGAHRPGDCNTTLGTTLVFKSISRQLARHAEGLVYSHKLPGGYWLPGAASNTGGEWIGELFPGEDFRSLDARAQGLLPNHYVAYPLVRPGERFPFIAPAARGFCLPEPESASERYAAYLQGVALVERLGYQVLEEATATSVEAVFSTGGGSRSDVWIQCRANATGRTMQRPVSPESAFGSAILAAAAADYGDLWSAVQGMVQIEKTFEPDPATASHYGELFDRFCAEIRQRGYA